MYHLYALINALMPSQCLLSHTDIYYLLSDIYINIYLFPEIQETAVFQAFSLPCQMQPLRIYTDSTKHISRLYDTNIGM